MNTNKDATPEQTERRQNQDDLTIHDPSSHFTVENLQAVTFGKIRATFDLRVGPLRLVDCRLVVGDDGAPKFISPARIKEHYTQTYRATVELDREFASDVFNAVVERLQGLE